MSIKHIITYIYDSAGYVTRAIESGFSVNILYDIFTNFNYGVVDSIKCIQ